MNRASEHTFDQWMQHGREGETIEEFCDRTEAAAATFAALERGDTLVAMDEGRLPQGDLTFVPGSIIRVSSVNRAPFILARGGYRE